MKKIAQNNSVDILSNLQEVFNNLGLDLELSWDHGEDEFEIHDISSQSFTTMLSLIWRDADNEVDSLSTRMTGKMQHLDNNWEYEHELCCDGDINYLRTRINVPKSDFLDITYRLSESSLAGVENPAAD